MSIRFRGKKLKLIFSVSLTGLCVDQRLWELVLLPEYLFNIKYLRYILHYDRVEFWFVKQINAKYWKYFFFHLWIPFCQYDRLFEFPKPLFFLSIFSPSPFMRFHAGSVAFASTNKRIIKNQWINLCKRWFLRSALPARFTIYSWIHSCVRYNVRAPRASFVIQRVSLLLHFITVNLLFPKNSSTILAMPEKFIFKMSKIDGSRQLKLQANTWSGIGDAMTTMTRETKSKTSTHTHTLS